MSQVGARPPTAAELVRAGDRISFLYLERATVHRDASAITATDKTGTVHIPAATLSTLLLGPGTRITHHAITLLAESGTTIVWVGENAVRYYAHGRGLSRNTTLLEAQARLVSNTRSRLAVAKAMYAMRFPGEDTTRLTMHQLRGKEGARVRKIYRHHADRTGVTWTKRSYDPNDFQSSDPINQALTAAHTALYGMVHSVVASLGCSPGLGFIHTGHDRAFIYDIADLYKATISIPIAFDIATEQTMDIATHVRRQMRDHMVEQKLASRIVKDLHQLLLGNNTDETTQTFDDIVMLWDQDQLANAGVNYNIAETDL